MKFCYPAVCSPLSYLKHTRPIHTRAQSREFREPESPSYPSFPLLKMVTFGRYWKVTYSIFNSYINKWIKKKGHSYKTVLNRMLPFGATCKNQWMRPESWMKDTYKKTLFSSQQHEIWDLNLILKILHISLNSKQLSNFSGWPSFFSVHRDPWI